MNRDELFLRHILEGISAVREFCHDGKEAFLADRKTRSAVLYELQTLAESTQRLSDELKSSHPQIPWRAISGFRNAVVHGYLTIDPERAWEVVEVHLPLLEAAVIAARNELRD